MALAVSLEEMGIKHNNPRAKILAKTLDEATGKLLENNKSPSRRTGELDNRGSHFYLGMYWAQAVVAQTEDPELAALFAPLAEAMTSNEDKIIGELAAVQGTPAELGGYYHAMRDNVKKVMRPSATLNAMLAQANSQR
jgi:isocitrate dehydrogenase